MELDPFTKKLLERTQARRENFNRMEANLPAALRKRRIPMTERTNNSSSEGDPTFQNPKKESPKRQYMDIKESNEVSDDNKSPKRQCIDIKENNEISDEDKAQNQEVISLEDEKENEFKMDLVTDQTLEQQCNFTTSNNGDKVHEMHEELTPVRVRGGCKKRLAALAAHINEWDDDTNYHFQSDRFATKPNSNSSSTDEKGPKSKTYSSSINNKYINNNNNNNTMPSIHKNNKSLIKSEIQLPIPPEVPIDKSNTSKKINIKPSPFQQQVKTVHVWDHAILATLDHKNSTTNSATKTSSRPNLKPIQESYEDDMTQSPTVYESNTNIVLQKTDTTNIPSLEDKNVDPAELPLSARRALFEKALLNGNDKKDIIANNPETLSVSERKALFEKASTVSNIPNMSNFQKSINKNKPNELLIKHKKEAQSSSPQKSAYSTLQKSSSTSIHTVPSSSTVNASHSPVRVGDHTRQLQQQLFESKDTAWQNNEISIKAKMERKKEMAALLNRWERASANTDDCASNQIEVLQNKKTSKDTLNENSLKFTVDSESKSSIEYEDSELDDRDSEIEHELCTKSSTEDEDITSNKPKNSADEAVAICSEIDEILDDAMSDETDNSNDSFIPKTAEQLPTEMQNDTDTSDCSSVNENNMQNTANSMLPSATSSSSSKASCFLPESVYDNGTEVPLLHTISFYRKQKQEQQSTPIRKIVRREEINNPPSPDEESRITVLQRKLKTLQEEVLSQQTIISQATQALNLCHATTEFFGSTEQVEGERLLLIATQKRQALLNEIQHLKTEGVLGQNSENGTGTLILSDIKLGMKQEFLAAHSEGKLGNDVHYFICLIHHNAQLIATQMLSTDGIIGSSLNYTNHITLQELQNDFNILFKVYALQTKKEIIPHDKKYHIKKECSKIKLTPKSKKDSRLLCPAISSPGGPNAVRTPSFALVGFTRLHLKNCNRSSYTLEKVPFHSPLEGIVHMKVQLHAQHKIEEKGFLTMFEDVSGFGAWHRRWCILRGNHLAYWKYPNDDKKKDPIGIIDLRQCVTLCVKLVSRDICARPHTFQLVSMRRQDKNDKNTLISYSKNTVTTTKHLLSADTKEERILWCNRLNDALGSIRKWDPEALKPVEDTK